MEDKLFLQIAGALLLALSTVFLGYLGYQMTCCYVTKKMFVPTVVSFGIGLVGLVSSFVILAWSGVIENDVI